MDEFIRGFSYFFSGFGFIIKPGIRRYVLIPLCINMVLFTIAIFFALNQVQDFINTLSGWWQWLEWLLWPFFVLVTLVIVFFSFSIIANLIAAPFNGLLAETVESYLEDGTVELPKRSLTNEIITSIGSELSKLLYFIVWAIPLLLLMFVPGLQLLWVVFGAWMLSLEYLDFPMANHGMTFSQERNLIKQKRLLALGFGSAVMTMALIPVLNFIVMPVAVCAATKLWFTEYKIIDLNQNS